MKVNLVASRYRKITVPKITSIDAETNFEKIVRSETKLLATPDI
jgi:hypothetical protein